MRIPRSIALLAALAGLCACSSGGGAEGPTYWKDVHPILAARCEGCHDAGGIGPFDLTGYPNAKAMAGAIAASTQSRQMPPWMPAPGPVFQHERRLSDAEIQTLQAWAKAGAPEGSRSEAPPVKTGDVPTIEADATIAMKAPYRPNATESDDYHCFVLDPQLTANTAVVGFDIHPGNRKIVHHVLLFAVPPSSGAQLDQLDASEPGEGYTCFGDSRVDDAPLVGAWVPGSTATVFPQGTGIVLEPGSRLVMQVHYNTLEVKDGTDQTTALLDYAKASDVTEAALIPVLQDEFSVPPGAVQTVTATFDSRDYQIPPGLKIKLHGVAPHMHLHGQRIRALLTHEDGTQETLIDIPHWDFHWQQLYFYDEPRELVLGDKLTLECTFDNRAESQPVVGGKRTEAQTLTWGEGTLSEMCLSFFYATY